MCLCDSDTAEILFVNTFNGNTYDRTELENGTIYIQTTAVNADSFFHSLHRIEFFAFYAVDVHFKINSINTIIIVTSKA